MTFFTHLWRLQNLFCCHCPVVCQKGKQIDLIRWIYFIEKKKRKNRKEKKLKLDKVFDISRDDGDGKWEEGRGKWCGTISLHCTDISERTHKNTFGSFRGCLNHLQSLHAWSNHNARIIILFWHVLNCI